jgi:integrase
MKKFIEYLKSKGISKVTIKRYLEYYCLFEDQINQYDLSQETINKFLMKHTNNNARAFLKNLLEMYEIDHTYKIPKLTGRKKKKKRKELTPLIAKALGRWLWVNKNRQYYYCFYLSYYCGLRRAEVMAINIHDFDIARWIEKKEKGCRLKIVGKGDKDRIVVVPLKLWISLKKYIKKNPQLIDLLFPFHFMKWHDAFKDAVKSTQDYNFTLHDLRRARATQWMKEGISMFRIKERLGHSDISSTVLYINPDEEKELELWENE